MATWMDEVKEESFIQPAKIESVLEKYKTPTQDMFDAVIKKAEAGKRLEIEEVAILLNSDSKDRVEKIFKTAQEIKERVYGHRVVLF